MRVLAEPSPGEPLQRGRAVRTFWLLLGLVLVGIGIIGIVVPLLPTTDFMLLAVPCFARSSPRLEPWLLNHPRFGPALRAWRSERAVPRNAKTMACIGMIIGYFVFLLHAQNWILSAVIGLFMLLWAVWIVRRPEPGSRR